MTVLRWLLLGRGRGSGALTTWPGCALPGRTDAGCTEVLLGPSGTERGRPGSLVRGRRVTVTLLRRVVLVGCIGQLTDGVDARVDVSFDDGAGSCRCLFRVHIHVAHAPRLTAVQHARLEPDCTHRVLPFRRSRSIGAESRSEQAIQLPRITRLRLWTGASITAILAVWSPRLRGRCAGPGEAVMVIV